MEIKNALVVYMRSNSKESVGCQELVKRTLEENKIEYDFIERTELSLKDLKGRDIVLTVGGDGTFLTASHFIFNDIPILGINSHSEAKEGFLCVSSRQNFSSHFAKVLKGDFRLQKRIRLFCTLDGKELMPVMNDVFAGHKKPYFTSQYYLELNGNRELHKGSGVIVSTPTGSHAWISSAGGSKMPLHSEHFQFKARDLYLGRLTKPDITGGVLDKSDTFVIVSDKEGSVVVIDSLSEEHPFEVGSTLEITSSLDKGLNFIVFK